MVDQNNLDFYIEEKNIETEKWELVENFLRTYRPIKEKEKNIYFKNVVIGSLFFSLFPLPFVLFQMGLLGVALYYLGITFWIAICNMSHSTMAVDLLPNGIERKTQAIKKAELLFVNNRNQIRVRSYDSIIGQIDDSVYERIIWQNGRSMNKRCYDE